MCFHHIEGGAFKDFSIGSQGHTRSWDRVREELDKCVLLCLNCHAETHAREDAAMRLA